MCRIAVIEKGECMIDFNKPLYTGNELEYMKQAIDNKKISGDGLFTKKCHKG